jgi:aryl-alcohol dehydrogenase-like predicted oxidoreductase
LNERMVTERQLGRNGLKVSAIGLGCMGMSQSYGPGDDVESVRTIHRAIDLGVTFLDTADVYGHGANEQLVGQAIRGRRQSVVLATKCGIVRQRDSDQMGLDGSPQHIKEACDASLQRLHVSVIDLFYLHRVDPQTPIEESVGAMSDLVRTGQVRYIGLSEAGPDTLRRGHAVHPITALQSEYSLWWRQPELSLLPICRELGIGFVPFSPLGRGFLSGQITGTDALAPDDMRRRLPRFLGDNLGSNLALVRGLEVIATRTGRTATQIALAWLLAKGEDIVPIPGTKRRSYVESNAAAAAIGLTPNEVAELDRLFDPRAPTGERYAPDLMRLLDASRE